MKKPNLVPVAFIVSLLCLPVAWYGGWRSGLNDGGKAANWSGSGANIVTIMGYRAHQEQGDENEAQAYLDSSLYSSAGVMLTSQDSRALTDDNRAAGKQILDQVADYYWKNPDSYNLSQSEWDEDDGPDGSLVGVLQNQRRAIRNLIMNNKPTNAEQGGVERP